MVKVNIRDRNIQVRKGLRPKVKTLNTDLSKLSKPVEVSLNRVYNQPNSLKLTAPKEILAIVDAYVDPFKSFKGFGTLPLAPIVIERLYDKLGPSNVALDPEVSQWHDNEIQVRRILNKELISPSLSRNAQIVAEDLYEFQRQGVSFMIANEMLPSNREGMRILQCDDPRLGKTIQTCVSVLVPRNTPALVVCLKSLKRYWHDQIKVWAPHVNPMILEGSIDERLEQMERVLRDGSNTVMITNWEFLRRIKEIPTYTRNKILTVIGDEAHMVRNRKAQVSKGLHSLRPINAILLTATPLERGPQEYFSYLKFLRPFEFTSYWRYVGWFCNTEHNGFGNEITGPRNIELLQDLLYPLMLRREAHDVADVPEKIFETIPVDTDPEFDALYAKIRDETLLEIINDEGEWIDFPNALTKLTRLRQLSTDPQLLDFRMRSPKLYPLLELAQDRFKEEKIVVFCSFNDALANLHMHLGDDESILFSGSQEEVDAFTNDPKKRIFLATPEKGGIGTTLGVANIIIYYNLPISSTLFRQSMDRTTLIGKPNPQLIINLAATPTDYAIGEELLQKKLDTVKAVDILTKIVAAERLSVYKGLEHNDE